MSWHLTRKKARPCFSSLFVPFLEVEMKIIFRLTGLLLIIALIIMSVRGFGLFVVIGGMSVAIALELVMVVSIIFVFFCFVIVIPEVLD